MFENTGTSKPSICQFDGTGIVFHAVSLKDVSKKFTGRSAGFSTTLNFHVPFSERYQGDRLHATPPSRARSTVGYFTTVARDGSRFTWITARSSHSSAARTAVVPTAARQTALVIEATRRNC